MFTSMQLALACMYQSLTFVCCSMHAQLAEGQSIICQSLLTLTCSDIDATSHICLP